ncbi:MAG TPA: hypothetical protein VN878_00745 [Usitatibacter sp.]|nr:hypothetical protein [Usitatibacter sp.]
MSVVAASSSRGEFASASAASRQFAVWREGPLSLLALRRHNLIVILADEDDVRGFTTKVLRCPAQFLLDERKSVRTHFFWQGVRITFAKDEWESLQAFVAAELGARAGIALSALS